MSRVCPGIKGESDAPGGQARTASAVDAKKGGADYIVVGRLITQADDPIRAIQKMRADLLKTVASQAIYEATN